MEFIAEFILIGIFSLPGAIIRWGLNGFKKGKLKYYLQKDASHNMFVFLCLLVSTCLVIREAMR